MKIQTPCIGSVYHQRRFPLTTEKKLVQITGTALFPGDIAPDFPTLSGGTVIIFGEERRIEQGMKARNPDGTVNYCQLEVV